MKRIIAVILIIIAFIIYVNIGYLVAYSTDKTLSRTPVTDTVWKIMNFNDFLDLKAMCGSNYDFAFAVAVWPVIVIMSWVANLAGPAVCWIFSGELLKFTGLIK